jgi:diaminohydroxyphosphoribosylaminopyrimidine deaminase / 5-amino-6-(5-phosphoribosylamino)uracil reductase
MARALDLARKGLFTVSPNPMVGAVIIRNDVCVGEGFHRRAGDAHAEVNALRDAGDKAHGADLYVTLEPCCVQGRTPPCTEAVISAGIKRVFVGATDPNPDVCGNGIARLREAGIEVIEGIQREEATWLNRAFNKWITTGIPWVTLKLAMTMDGKTAASTGKSQWITSEAIRQHVHVLRAASDAIMVGSGTANIDNPRLNVRGVEPLFEGGEFHAPLKVIVGSSVRLSPSSRILEDGETLVVTHGAEGTIRDPSKHPSLAYLNTPGSQTKVHVGELLKHLGGRSTRPVCSILVEGGATLATSMVREGLVDELRLHIAPKLIGGDGLSVLHSLGIVSPDDADMLQVVAINTYAPDIEIIASFR